MPDNAFPLDEAEIVGLFVESVFYGIYLVSFGACMRVLFSGAGIRSNVNKAMLIVAILMVTLGTIDLALGLRNVLHAFLWYDGPGGPTADFEKISNWLPVMKSTCYIVQILLGDLILIYRCYMAYTRSWFVIALPLTMWIGTLVCGSAELYISSHLRVNTNVDEKHIVPFFTAVLSLTMVQNIGTTSMLAYRIWSIDRRISQFRSSTRQDKLKPVIRLIVESGAIYTLTMIVVLIVFLCRNNGQYAASDASIMVIGIVFNIIIIRVHEGRTVDQEAASSSGVPSSTQPFGFAKTATGRGTLSSSYPLTSFGTTDVGGHAAQRVEVNVAREVVKTGGDDHDSIYVERMTNKGPDC